MENSSFNTEPAFFLAVEEVEDLAAVEETVLFELELEIKVPVLVARLEVTRVELVFEDELDLVPEPVFNKVPIGESSVTAAIAEEIAAGS